MTSTIAQANQLSNNEFFYLNFSLPVILSNGYYVIQSRKKKHGTDFKKILEQRIKLNFGHDETRIVITLDYRLK